MNCRFRPGISVALFISMLNVALTCHAADTPQQTLVAITIDDIPGPSSRSSSATEVATRMLAVFRKHNLQGVYGMMVGGNASNAPQSLAVLKQWVSDGQLLGSHTWSHPDLASISADEFIADIRKNEPLLQEIMGSRDWRFFRFPYLAEGDTPEKRNAVRQFLAQGGYRTAEVTMDFFDSEWVEPYERCLKLARMDDARWLRTSYVENALYGLEIAERLSAAVAGRPIKHVLLLHFGRIQADVLDELLTKFEERGVRFVGLHEALSDPIYEVDTAIVRPRSYTFLNQLRLKMGLRNPSRVQELYDLLPEERLSSICK